jgi:phosphorylcholine metabolism protein LicD
MKHNQIDTYFNSSLGFGEHKQIAIDLLKITTDILNEFNIEYFLISGTLLGLTRHNDFIPFDDDIDLIVGPEIKDKISDIMKKYNSEISLVMKDGIIKTCFKDKVLNLNNFKIWSNYLVNKKDSYFWPFIDLFIFNYSTDRKSINFFGKDWDFEEFFPGQIKNFNGLNVSIPKNPEYFLRINYGKDYMKILKSSNWNHKQEFGIPKQYYITIEEYYGYIKRKTSNIKK